VNEFRAPCIESVSYLPRISGRPAKFPRHGRTRRALPAHTRENCRRCLKVAWHAEYQPQRHVSGPAFSLELIAAGDPEELDIVVRKIEVDWQ
jgi:hypothetical protein